RLLTPLRPVGKIHTVDATGFDTFVHRDYAELFALVPAIAVGSIAAFMLKDRLSGEAVPEILEPVASAEGARATLSSTLHWLIRSWPAQLRAWFRKPRSRTRRASGTRADDAAGPD